MTTIHCAACQVPFEIWPHEICEGRKYCSRKCFTVGGIKVRFDSHADKTSSDRGCWAWTGTTSKDGRGRFGANYRSNLAYRVSWEIHKGTIPRGLFVLHKCDNPNCVNPEHLFLGTHQDNMDDKRAKGRLPLGEEAYQAKLTEAQVVTARMLFAGKKVLRGMRATAHSLGVSTATLRDAVVGNTWKWLDTGAINKCA